MPFINYQELKRMISLAEVLDMIGYRCWSKIGDQGYGRCPFSCPESAHKKGAYRCASFDFERGLWKCHRCRAGGNQIELFAAVKCRTLYDAARELCLRRGIDPPVRRD